MPGETNPGSDAPLDINAILTGTSEGSDPTGAGGAGTGGEQGSGEGQQGFKFGGRSYADQKAAEAAHNKLYGRYSESQGLIKQFKELASKNPARFAELAKDPEFAEVLAKLGIQQAEEDLDREIEEEREERDSVTIESLAEQIRVDRASFALERDEARFERKLGRDVTDEEHNTVMKLFATGLPLSFTYENVWKLAFHDKLLKEAATKAAGSKPGGNRPRPTPPGIPGTKLDLKKAVTDMNPAEWREAVRQSPEFQGLMNP